jgi:hypothetical protein
MEGNHVIKDILNFILNDEDKLDLNNVECVKNKNDIIDYLEKGYKVSTVSTIRVCEVCGEEAGPFSYFSDGYWIWPIWLIHYIREHDLNLPDSFLEHIESSNFEINKEFVERLIEDENTEIG